MTKYGMVVDTRRCVACSTCAMACKAEHNLPNGVFWNKAITEGAEDGAMFVPAGTYPNVSMKFYTLACQHCDEPACVSVCATGATFKREEDGIVVTNYEECIGCQLCVTACPYGVRVYLEKEPEYYLDFPVGDESVPDHMQNTVEKCTFCVERIDRGERPACVDICRANARFFGDLDDPDSEVSKLLKEHTYHRLLEEQGTGPNVYFID